MDEKISCVQLRDGVQFEEFSPTEKLCDEGFIEEVVEHCLEKEDFEGVREAIDAHLDALERYPFSGGCSFLPKYEPRI